MGEEPAGQASAARTWLSLPQRPSHTQLSYGARLPACPVACTPLLGRSRGAGVRPAGDWVRMLLLLFHFLLASSRARARTSPMAPSIRACRSTEVRPDLASIDPEPELMVSPADAGAREPWD
jgi:hypothetical protein